MVQNPSTIIMSVRGVSSQGNSTQPMLAKDICIFIATDDLTWHNIILTMLPAISFKGSWSVLHTGKADDVLNAMCERKEHVSAVFTNVHRLSSKGFDILQNIKSRLNVQPFVMSPDDEDVAISEKGSIFVAYIVNSLNVNDIIKMWQSTVETLKEKQGGKQTASGTTDEVTRFKYKRGREESLEEDEELVGGREDGPLEKKQNVKETSIDEVTRFKCHRGIEESSEEDEELRGGREDGPSEKKQRVKVRSIDEVPRVHCKRGIEDSSEESEEEDDEREHGRGEKKPRMVWTREMHQKFVEAIEILGHEKAFPKKIVEVMEVHGLTRENVASHLQKYRMCIKRSEETDPNSLHGMNQTTALQNQCLSSGGSHFLSKFPYGNNSYLRRNVYGAYAQPPSQRTLPNGFYPSATMYPRSCQMDIRNAQRINGNGLMNSQYRYSPNIMLKRNFRVYNDPTKNVLMNIGGRSLLDANRPSLSDPCSSFLGFRLTGDGKSVEVGGKCIANSINTIETETLPQPLASENTSQFVSTLNESQTSFLSIEDYGYNEGNLIQPPPMSANCPRGQEPFSEQSSILENELNNLYSPTLPENEYSNQYCSRLDSVRQQQSFLPIYQAPGGISPATSSTPNGTSSQQQVFMPHCQSSDDTLVAPCSMNMDPILQQLASPSLFEVLGNESSAQSPTISGSCIQHQYSVPPVPTSSNVGTFQYTATPTIEESPLPSLPSHLDELDSFLSGIGDDFWNSDIDDIINTINS